MTRCTCKTADSHARLLKEVLHSKVVAKEHGEMLSSILTVLNSILDRLPQSQSATLSDVATFPFALPLDSVENLMAVEDCLTDERVRENLIGKIAQIGGSSLGNCVRRMLSKLLTNEVAACFSWLESKGKNPFSPLKISSILFSAIRRNPASSMWSDRDIENVIKDWLRHAKARCKMQ